MISRLSGKLVFKSISKIILDVSGIRNGIYIVSVQNEKGFATGKLVICK